MAVSKTVGAAEVAEAYGAGQRIFAENRVQNLLEKLSSVEAYGLEQADWQLIGTLQTNKVKYIIDKVSLIHSVDSAHLADEIDRCAAKHGRKMDCLLQVNVSGEMWIRDRRKGLRGSWDVTKGGKRSDLRENRKMHRLADY